MGLPAGSPIFRPMGFRFGVGMMIDAAARMA